MPVPGRPSKLNAHDHPMTPLSSTSVIALPPVPPLHPCESERLAALHGLALLDTPPERRFDRLTRLLAKIFEAPISTITLVDSERQWHKSVCGTDDREGPRRFAFCAYTLLEEQILVVEDATRDERFRDNPLVVGGPRIRFYAGAPLRNSTGLPVGTLCLIDTKARRFAAHERDVLLSFARLVEGEIFPDHDVGAERFSARISARLDPALACLARSGFCDRIEERLGIDGRSRAKSAMIGVRINGLESVNYVHGVEAGNLVLFETVARFRAALAEVPAFVGRLDKNTLAALIDVRSDVQCRELAVALTRLLRTPLALNDGEFHPSLCIGVLESTGEFTGVTTLLSALEDVLSQCAKIGGNLLYYHTDDAAAEIRRRGVLRGKVSNALYSDAFRMVFQPKVALGTREIVGFEALLRWHDSELGVVPPPDIVGLLEELGLEYELGKWTIRTVTRQLSEWCLGGVPARPVSINLSRNELKLPGFPNLVESILREFRVSPALIEFEILEQSLMTDAATAIENMNRLRRLGITFSIDDFGTGYSALRMLTQLPVDTIKIDRSFIADMVENRDDAALVHSIIGIGHDGHRKCVAEGVETFEQFLILRALNCDHGQGYLFSKPVDAAAVPALLRNGLAPIAGG